ncbi:MAG: hypothetical protein QOF01_5474 [Thermomicrobiales bacterium]|nr:hypothetical protein [Thermomicrobiales bacterium]MEA2599005.1 hypothetical protein [Thermomicrobiales bacterium]
MESDREELVNKIGRLFQQLTWQGRQRLQRRLEVFGLSAPQYVVLSMVRRLGPGVSMGEVAESLQLPASSMTSITDRLVRLGLVERGTLPTDRRAVVATITEAGEDLIRTVEENQHRDLVGILEDTSDPDLERFGIVLARLLEGIQRALAEPTDTVEEGVRGP